MQTLFTSDLHIGHKNICKYRPEFKDANTHHEFMIEKILKLSKRQLLIVVGDFLFDCEKYEEYIKILNTSKCRIKLIMGNHDSLKLYKESKFEVQLPFYSYKNFWISHAPIHEQELRNREGNIHGHLHKEFITRNDENNKIIKDNRYYNVNIDVNNYEFVTFENIKNINKKFI